MFFSNDFRHDLGWGGGIMGKKVYSKLFWDLGLQI